MGCHMMAATDVQTSIQKQIDDNTVFVVSKSYCPFCTKAKNALKKVTDDFTVIEIESDSNCDAIQDYMKDITGGRSVPRVFIGGKFFGGGDDTAAGVSNGKLKKALEAAGVTTK